MLIQYSDIKMGADRLAMIEKANEIIGEYDADGYTLTLRQLYYQFVSRDLIPNSERSYKNLGNLIADGRMAGLISWLAIEDRGRGVRGWIINEDESEVLNGIEANFAMDFWAPQETHVEIWVEKEALVDVIRRPAERYRVDYMACKGYLSASEAWRAGRRFRLASREGKRLVLIHLGDHDPSGIDMTRDNGDRINLFGGGLDVEVRRIALNMNQVEEYAPPPNPAKMSDSRAEDYVSKFGHTSWELDALNPRILDKLISDEVDTLIDLDVWRATQKEERERRKILAEMHERFDDIRDFLNETRDTIGDAAWDED